MYFLLLILFHLLGSFYFQKYRLGKCKLMKIEECLECEENKEISGFGKNLFVNALIYIIPFLLVFFMADFREAILGTIIVLFSHCLITLFTSFLNNKCKKTVSIIVDQALHLFILFVVFASTQSVSINSYHFLIKLLVLVLLLIVPSSLLIDCLKQDIFNTEEQTAIFEFDSMLGIIERILFFFLLYLNQLLAVIILIVIITWIKLRDLENEDYRKKYLLTTLLNIGLSLIVFIFVSLF